MMFVVTIAEIWVSLYVAFFVFLNVCAEHVGCSPEGKSRRNKIDTYYVANKAAVQGLARLSGAYAGKNHFASVIIIDQGNQLLLHVDSYNRKILGGDYFINAANYRVKDEICDTCTYAIKDAQLLSLLDSFRHRPAYGTERHCELHATANKIFLQLDDGIFNDQGGYVSGLLFDSATEQTNEYRYVEKIDTGVVIAEQRFRW